MVGAGRAVFDPPPLRRHGVVPTLAITSRTARDPHGLSRPLRGGPPEGLIVLARRVLPDDACPQVPGAVPGPFQTGTHTGTPMSAARSELNASVDGYAARSRRWALVGMPTWAMSRAPHPYAPSPAAFTIANPAEPRA